MRRRAKRKHRRIALLLVLAALMVVLALMIAGRAANGRPAAAGDMTTPLPSVTADILSSEQPTALPTPAPRYALTASERDVVERVVMAEAGGEPYEGQMLVAQCILTAAEKTGMTPSEVVVAYQYAKGRPDPTQSVKDAVVAVFDDGEVVLSEPVMYFYNPAKVTSTWHESQIFVIEVGNHRFFAERSPEE